MRFILFSLFFLIISITFAGPGNLAPFTVTQPDKSQLTLRVFGDEYYNRCETIDGYTIMLRSDNWWVYAQRNVDGTLSPSNIIARSKNNRISEELDFLQQTGKHIQPSKTIIEKLLEQNPHRLIDRSLTSKLSKTSGNAVIRKVLVLLIEFPDLAHQEELQTFDGMFNQQGWNGGIGSTGSFNDYYNEVSYGKFGIQADVNGWYMASHNLSYYAWSGAVHWNRSKELVLDAINQAKSAGVDFSKYDNDGDGTAESIIVVHAGPGASQNGDTRYIWTHKNNLNSPVYYDGVKISSFTMNEELEYNRHSGIGNYVHEYGHALGLPDLYDYDFSSEGVGNWCVMSAGAWLNAAKTPPHFCAWAKEELNWVSPTLISANGDYSFSEVETNVNAVYKVAIPNYNSEYFLIENRQKQMFDSYLPNSGLLIWHIDNSVSNNDNEEHKRVDLEEADGLSQLDKASNRGDSGDPYPGLSGNRVFDSYSLPNSKSYDGNFTRVSISDISNSALTMTAKITLTGAAFFDTSIKTGHAPLKVNFQDLSLSNSTLNSWVWDFQNDGTVDATIQNPSFTFNQPGHYNIKLQVSDGINSYSTIRQNFVKVFNGTSSIYFNEQTHSYTVPASNTLNPSDNLTFEAWIKPADWGTTANGEGYLFDKSYLYSFLQKTATTDYYQQSLVIGIKDDQDNIAKWCTPANSISLNTWQHIAITYNGASLEMKIYINGINQNLKQIGRTNTKIKANGGKALFIGNNNSIAKSFVGTIDEMRFWGILRTGQEIQANMEKIISSTETGLLAYYKMDEGSGSSLLDSSPNKNNATGSSSWQDGKELTGTSVNVENENSELPSSYELHANYPNPFNPSTKIKFGLPVEANVTIRVFNILGQEVSQIINNKLTAGYHEINFNAASLPSGVYLYSINAKGNDGSNYIKTLKMLLMK